MSRILMIVAFSALLCGCATRTHGTGQIISAYVPSHDVAINLKNTLISFAISRGLKSKVLDESDKFSGNPNFVVLYDTPHARGYTAVALEYIADAGKTGGCFSVNIVLTRNNQSELTSLVNQIKQIMRAQLPAHTDLYKDTYCGVRPMIATSSDTYRTVSLAQ